MNFDLSKVFDQYLRDVKIPLFEYYFENGKIYYKWSNVITGFDMPLEISLDNKIIKLFPETDWKFITVSKDNIKIDKNYYVNSSKSLK